MSSIDIHDADHGLETAGTSLEDPSPDGDSAILHQRTDKFGLATEGIGVTVEAEPVPQVLKTDRRRARIKMVKRRCPYDKRNRVRGRHKVTCGACGGYGTLIECDTCTSSWHGFCVKPVIDADLPPDWWSCPDCLKYGSYHLQAPNSEVEILKDMCGQSLLEPEKHQDTTRRGVQLSQGPVCDGRIPPSVERKPNVNILPIPSAWNKSSTTKRPISQPPPRSGSRDGTESHNRLDGWSRYSANVSEDAGSSSSKIQSQGAQERSGLFSGEAELCNGNRYGMEDKLLNYSGPRELTNWFQQVRNHCLVLLEALGEGFTKSQSNVQALQEALTVKTAKLEEFQLESESIRRDRDNETAKLQVLTREYEEMKSGNEDLQSKFRTILGIIEEDSYHSFQNPRQ